MLSLDTEPTVIPDGSALEDSRDQAKRQRVYLHGGQIFASAAPTIVTTIVGSCVAVCLSDRSAGIGGVNHFFLPDNVGGAASPRFGNVAIPRLIEEVLAAGARRERLEAKVFGGACILPEAAASGCHLGAVNVRLAFHVLRQQGIPVLAEDVEGRRGRRIAYHTDTGVAWVRRL
jgi:chemotaxis protein CheD